MNLMADQSTVELRPQVAHESEIANASRIYTYLASADSIKGGPEDFPAVLDVHLFEEYMRGLDGERKTVSQEIHPGESKLGIKPLNLEGEGEAAKAIYYDNQENVIKATETRFGDLSSAKTSFYDAYNKGTPLVEMHTHPSLALPSVVDYRFLLIGDPASRARAIRAIAVFCPKVQFLALATDKTPFLTPDEVNQLFSERGERSLQYEGEQGKYLKTLFARTERIKKIQAGLISAKFKKMIEGFKRELGEEDSGGYDHLFDKSFRVGAKAFSKYNQYLNRVFTGIQMQFAKDMGIKLYASADFRNFEALT